MSSNKVFYYLCVLLFFLSPTTEAQRFKEKIPLHQFFQSNYDSTIIYYGWSSWGGAPNYFIVSKKDSNTYYFSYTSPYRKMFGYKIPGDLDFKFMLEQSKFENTPPDTNRYFFPVKIHYSLRNKYWTDINAFNIWRLTDDIKYSSKCETTDGGKDIYYLITTAGIKSLSFYNADSLEDCEPDTNRQNEIKTRNLIMKIFNENK